MRTGETIAKEHARAEEELPKNLSSSSSNAPAREDRPERNDDDDEEEFYRQWSKAIPIANRLLKVLAPESGLAALSGERREWIVKVALLAVRFGSEWIEPAFEQLRHSRARNPQALMAAILDGECQLRGTRFHRETGRLVLPADFAERLPCASGSRT